MKKNLDLMTFPFIVNSFFLTLVQTTEIVLFNNWNRARQTLRNMTMTLLYLEQVYPNFRQKRHGCAKKYQISSYFSFCSTMTFLSRMSWLMMLQRNFIYFWFLQPWRFFFKCHFITKTSWLKKNSSQRHNHDFFYFQCYFQSLNVMVDKIILHGGPH